MIAAEVGCTQDAVRQAALKQAVYAAGTTMRMIGSHGELGATLPLASGAS